MTLHLTNPAHPMPDKHVWRVETHFPGQAPHAYITHSEGDATRHALREWELAEADISLDEEQVRECVKVYRADVVSRETWPVPVECETDVTEEIIGDLAVAYHFDELRTVPDFIACTAAELFDARDKRLRPFDDDGLIFDGNNPDPVRRATEDEWREWE